MHHHSQSLLAAHLDTRADSPMRDDVQILNDESSQNRNTPHGLPTPANDVPSSGFTAVNGDSARHTSFRPDDSAMNRVNGEYRKPDVVANGHTHPFDNRGRRSQERQVPEPDRDPAETVASSKRKRADSASTASRENGRDDRSHIGQDASPKRRMTVLNSGGIGTPDRYDQSRTSSSEPQDLGPATTGTYVRERTPPYKADRRDPPPLARPEVEAGLAASLHATLRSQQQAEANAQSASPVSPDEDPQEQQPDESQTADGSDPKKRKRNFSNRTKTGCHTCRARKKKCDEGKPVCENCKRGSFTCGGYGPKPTGLDKHTGQRVVAPLQPLPYPYEQHPGHHFAGSPRPPPHWETGARPDPYQPQPYRYVPPPPPGPVEHRPPPPPPERWDHRPPPYGAPPPPQPSSYLSTTLPPVDFSNVRPPYPHQPPAVSRWGEIPYSQPTAPPQPVASRPVTVNSDGSASANSYNGRPSLTIPIPTIPPLPGPPSDRTKMLRGEPYGHYLDNELLNDRTSCKKAVEIYNEANAALHHTEVDEKIRCFKAILDPKNRTFDELSHYWSGPVGECGSRTVVEAPFACEFGYNIKLGDECVIGANCLMEDANFISIGNRVIVGKNVSFHCLTTSIDPNRRGGSQGAFMSGAITVEDDVVIFAGATILPYRTIGKGAVVGAGSVVTRDVKPYTVVAGNPAKYIRKRKNQLTGPNADRHEDDEIQEENDKMMEEMRRRATSIKGRNDGIVHDEFTTMPPFSRGRIMGP